MKAGQHARRMREELLLLLRLFWTSPVRDHNQRAGVRISSLNGITTEGTHHRVGHRRSVSEWAAAWGHRLRSADGDLTKSRDLGEWDGNAVTPGRVIHLQLLDEAAHYMELDIHQLLGGIVADRLYGEVIVTPSFGRLRDLAGGMAGSSLRSRTDEQPQRQTA